jgi:hypothetical protein
MTAQMPQRGSSPMATNLVSLIMHFLTAGWSMPRRPAMQGR